MTLATRYRGGSGFAAIWYPTSGSVSGGTIVASGDYTAFEVNYQIDTIEVTAGSETSKSYIPGIADGDATLTFFDTGAAGTQLLQAFQEGTTGTLIYGPLGTATNSPKRGFLAISLGPKEKIPFDKAVEIEVKFQKTGPRLFDASAKF